MIPAPQKHLEALYDQALQLRDGGDSESGGSLADLAPGWPFSDDELLEEGGMKRVYRTLDRRTRRLVARAELRDPSADPRRFLREARITAALEHPNIVPVYDIGLCDDGGPYFCMKLGDGSHLHSLLESWRQGQPPELPQRLEIFCRICDALAYAHGAGVIHLDLKPANIQISHYGEVLVCDWGLARIVDEACEDPRLLEHSLDQQELRTLTADGFIKGTPGYMSPEQAGGPQHDKDQRSDIYSLGAILYALLCLQPPYRGSPEEIVAATRQGAFIPLASSRPDLAIPVGLEAICLKAMARQPEDRYASVSQMQKDIDAYRHGFAPQAEHATILKQLALSVNRHRMEGFLLFSGLLIIFGTSLAFVDSLSEKEAELRSTKIRAEHLERSLESERERSRRLGRSAARGYAEMAIEAEQKFLFARAATLAEQSIEQDPSLTKPWGTKALMHFIQQDFSQAAEAYRQFGKADYHYMQQWSDELAGTASVGPLPRQDWLEIVDRLRTANAYVYERCLRAYAERKAPVAEHWRFIRHLLPAGQAQPGAWHLEWRDGFLDLSGNPGLVDIRCLQAFPARRLSLAGTQVGSLDGLRDMPLESLDLRDTPVKDLKILATLPLVEIDLRGPLHRDLDPLLKASKLKRLRVSPGVYTADEASRFRHLEWREE